MNFLKDHNTPFNINNNDIYQCIDEKVSVNKNILDQLDLTWNESTNDDENVLDSDTLKTSDI